MTATHCNDCNDCNDCNGTGDHVHPFADGTGAVSQCPTCAEKGIPTSWHPNSIAETECDIIISLVRSILETGCINPTPVPPAVQG